MKTISVPVIQDTCLGYAVFRGSIKARDLADAVWTDFYDEVYNPNGYQRPFDKAKSRNAASYAEGNEKAFWPELILSIRANVQLGGRVVEEVAAGAPFAGIPIARGASLLQNIAGNTALEGGVLQLYRDAVAPNGVIDPLKHARFMRRFEDNFNEFPKLKQMLNDKSAAVETLNLRSQELTDNIDEINNSIWLKYKDFGGQEPSLIIKDAIKNPRTMSRTVLAMPKNARESFAASVLSDIYETSRKSDGVIDPNKLNSLITENGEAIQTALRHLIAQFYYCQRSHHSALFLC